MTRLPFRYHVGITSVLRRYLIGFTATSIGAATAAAAQDAGHDAFVNLVYDRCLPAVYTDTPLDVSGLRKLDAEAAQFFVGNRGGDVWVPAVDFVILYDVAPNACSVQFYAANPATLTDKVDARLTAGQFPFRAGESGGDVSARLARVYVSDATTPATKVYYNTDAARNLAVISVVKSEG